MIETMRVDAFKTDAGEWAYTYKKKPVIIETLVPIESAYLTATNLISINAAKQPPTITEEFVIEGGIKSGHKRPTDQGAGLTQKGVDAENRKTGGNLQTAVTTPPSKLKAGSKAAGRRKSFCARSRGWNGERGKAARRRWNC